MVFADGQTIPLSRESKPVLARRILAAAIGILDDRKLEGGSPGHKGGTP